MITNPEPVADYQGSSCIPSVSKRQPASLFMIVMVEAYPAHSSTLYCKARAGGLRTSAAVSRLARHLSERMPAVFFRVSLAMLFYIM